jgi:hypothetical protein
MNFSFIITFAFVSLWLANDFLVTIPPLTLPYANRERGGAGVVLYRESVLVVHFHRYSTFTGSP